ncbi:RNA-binding protein pop5 [Microbotryomycetes sp. JL221]|nr:RNA-binding protein pop5 [Microbotryomycetes sp. JL221]
MVRFKHRYLLVELLFPNLMQFNDDDDHDDNIDKQATLNDNNDDKALAFLNESVLMQTLRDSLLINFGERGAGEVGGAFSIKYFSLQTHTVIIRVSRQHFRTLWSSLTLLRKLAGQPVIATVVHVGGSIKKTQHAAIAHDRVKILQHANKINSKRPRTDSTTVTEQQVDQETINARLLASETSLLAMQA